ncbi:fibroblast growth factor receptor 2-like isoform X2 [Apostichopus japonicus]|uniref:fibroblast growth factor receptor 2-like isoform X2 n=1 Tax=Stichopus japonicus TaxID=307972 RepID=UPI003AB304BB
MDYVAMLLLIILCHVYKGYVSATSPVLCFKTGNVFEQNFSCDAEPGDDVCLVCPVNISNKLVTWSRHGNFLYAGLNKLHKEATILQNTCDPVLSSIQLRNISLDQFNDAYECRKGIELVKAYILKITTYPSLSIENNVSNELDEEIASLICRADNVLAPITLTWFVNEQREYEELFSETNDHSVTSTFSFNQYVNATVKCQVNGSHIKPANVTYNYQMSTSVSGNIQPMGVIGVFVLILSMLVAALFIYKYYIKNISRHGRPVEREIRFIDTVASDGVAELNVQPDIIQVTNDENDLGSTIALQTCIKEGKKFEYWTGTFGDDEKREVFVKTLSKGSTLADANKFRELALSLKKLRRHRLLVDRLLVSVENVPSVYYNYISNGTMRDMLMSQYQEARKSRVLTNNKKKLAVNMKSQVEVLLYFSREVASAMVFLSSQKFCHPVLSTRKVLLTEHGHCKLYDICPENMAMYIVMEKLDKEYPPIMWMSPEAVFLKQYSVDSDVWNYGTFLWEVFSLGEVPYPGLSKQQLEEKIRQTILLAQPICCPGALYSIMLLCWNTTIDCRPNFQTILEKVSTLFENVKVEEQVLTCRESDCYTSLNTS